MIGDKVIKDHPSKSNPSVRTRRRTQDLMEKAQAYV